MMYNKVAILIKHTDQTYCVLLYTSEIYNWIKKKYSRSFILATHAWKGEGGVRGRKNQQTDRREEIASSLVKTRDKLECKAMHCLLREAKGFARAYLEENCEPLGTDNVQGQISDHISRQMEAIVFIILQIFFATCAVLKIREYFRILPGNVRSRDVFRSIARERKYLMDNWYIVSYDEF